MSCVGLLRGRQTRERLPGENLYQAYGIEAGEGTVRKALDSGQKYGEGTDRRLIVWHCERRGELYGKK